MNSCVGKKLYYLNVGLYGSPKRSHNQTFNFLRFLILGKQSLIYLKISTKLSRYPEKTNQIYQCITS